MFLNKFLLAVLVVMPCLGVEELGKSVNNTYPAMEEITSDYRYQQEGQNHPIYEYCKNSLSLKDQCDIIEHYAALELDFIKKRENYFADSFMDMLTKKEIQKFANASEVVTAQILEKNRIAKKELARIGQLLESKAKQAKP